MNSALWAALAAIFSCFMSIGYVIYKAGILTNSIENQRDNVIRNENEIKTMKTDFLDTLKRLHERIDKTESGFIKNEQCKELRENVITSYGQNNDLICSLMKKLDERMEKIENKVDVKLDNLQVEINRLSKKMN